MGLQVLGGRHQSVSNLSRKTGCLDIRLGMRLPRLPRIVGVRMTTQTAAWSLGVDRFTPGSQQHGSSSGNRAFCHRNVDKRSINPWQRAKKRID